MTASEANKAVIEQFRAGGEVQGMHRDRLVLLTTMGRVTGDRQTAPMMFLRDDPGILVIASGNAALEHPDWYLNLVAEPRVHVEEPDVEYDAIAHVIEADERDEVWSRVLDQAPFFADHQEQVDREIPVVRLLRA